LYVDTRGLTLSQWQGSLAKEVKCFHSPEPHPHRRLLHLDLQGQIRNQPPYQIRTSAMQSTTLLVGVIRLLTSSYSERGSGPELHIGNQSPTNISKPALEDRGISPLLPPVTPPRLETPRAAVDISNKLPTDNLGQQNQSGTSISHIPLWLLSETRNPQASIYVTRRGTRRISASRRRVMGSFQSKELARMHWVRTLVVRRTTVLVGVIHLLTFSYSEFFADQICKPGTSPITSRPQMAAKPSKRARKYRSPRRIRINRNHHRNQSRTIKHRIHEWMASVASKFSFLDDRTFSDLTVVSCKATPLT